MVPGLIGQPGIEVVYAGRSGGRNSASEHGERVTVSVWSAGSVDEESRLPHRMFEFETVPGVEAAAVEVVPLVVSIVDESEEPAKILRVFRGTTRVGELVDFAEEVRMETLAERAAGRGPTCLYLGVARPDALVAVSAWTSWDRIADATGGNMRNPVATRYADRLASWTAKHYEIVPNSVARRQPDGSAGR